MIPPAWWMGPIAPVTPPPTSAPVPTWTNPTDWDPQPGDRVRLHLDGWGHYAKIGCQEGDTATLGHADPDRGGWIVHFENRRGPYSGLFFHLSQLELIR